MVKLQLLPGDKYDGRCAEIYITEKRILIYHCSMCEEIYTTFNELLRHITKDHYENAKDYSKVEASSIEIINQQEVSDEENLLAPQEILSETKKSNKELEINLAISNKVDGSHKHTTKNNSFENIQGITGLNDDTGEEDPKAALDSSEMSPQRKKPRFVTGMLKTYAIGRAKLNSLSRYQVNPNEERKYVCGICGFAFKERYNLRGHLLRHSNQKNFSCTICPKKFFTKVELRLHECRHKGERQYLCNHCGMGFVSSGSLTQHIKKHHSLHRPFKCDNCDKAFTNFYQLRDHKLVHTDERNFMCPQCPLTFKCRRTLNNHVKLHENKLRFRCESCDLGFSAETALKTHQRKKHNFNDESDYEIMIERRYVANNDNEDVGNSDDNVRDESTTEGEFVLEENFDEYELVQTLTDLECNKNV